MSFIQNYILDDRKRPQAVDLLTWATWFQIEENVRLKTTEGKGCRVSTVFLGNDPHFGRPPLRLFETMIFGGLYDLHLKRDATYDEAMLTHEAFVVLTQGINN